MCTYGFGLQLATLHADHSAFSRAKLAGPFEFSVRHYAGEVLYHAEGFLDKNRDSVGEACRDLLAKSSVPLVSVVVVWLVVLAGVGGWRVRGGGGGREENGVVASCCGVDFLLVALGMDAARTSFLCFVFRGRCPWRKIRASFSRFLSGQPFLDTSSASSLFPPPKHSNHPRVLFFVPACADCKGFRCRPELDGGRRGRGGRRAAKKEVVHGHQHPRDQVQGQPDDAHVSREGDDVV